MVYKEKNQKKWTKDGRKWYFRVYKTVGNNNKQFKSKMFLSKKEAQDEEAIFLLKKNIPYAKPFETVANDFFKYLFKTRKESTVISYKYLYQKHIKSFFKNYNINDIKVNDIFLWKEEMLKKQFSINYLNKSHVFLSSIFDFAIKNYNLDINPVKISGRFEKVNDKVIDDKEKIRYITKEDFEKFISVIDNKMYYTLFNVLFYTGIRKGELQALNWNDVDFNNSLIIINKTLTTESREKYKITTTKNYINRKILLNKKLKEILLDYKKEVMKYTDFKNNWFIFGNSSYLPRTTIDRYKNKYFNLAEVKKITVHEFRHSHVSFLVNEYIKSGQTDTTKFFVMMSNRLGHSIPVMQKTYLHLFPTIQNEIIEILNNI